MTELKGMTGLKGMMRPHKLLYQKLNYPRYTKVPSPPKKKQKTVSVSLKLVKRSSENLKIRFSDDLSIIGFYLSVLTRTNVANFGVPFCVKPR